MMQCRIHQNSWMEHSFSGGSCPECEKDRRRHVQQIDKLTATNKKLMEELTKAIVDNIELRAQVKAISLECVQLRNQLPAWIPCSVMMPKERRHVLVWVPNILCAFTAYLEYGDWHCAFSNDWLQGLEITHWMPLPEAPKP